MLSEKDWINQRELTPLKRRKIFKRKTENCKSCLWDFHREYFWVRKASCSKLCIIWRYTPFKENIVKKKKRNTCMYEYLHWVFTYIYICMSIENYRRLYTELLIEMRNFLVVQWLELHLLMGVGSIPGQKLRSHTPGQKRKHKTKQRITNTMKTYKNGPHQNILKKKKKRWVG